ncbi:MAG: ABC-2 transporter permease, partial [Aureliella sp.]
MNRKLAVGHLWWKELRQLLPLVGLLFIVGLLLQLLTLVTPSDFEWRNAAVVLGMPGLFAAGAGALLVGQEKELHTFNWLRSLPVPPRDVVRTKLLAGLLGLLLVWLVSLSLVAAVGSLP